MVSTLKDKGFRVTFMEGKNLLWNIERDLTLVELIGIREAGLYKLPSHPI